MGLGWIFWIGIFGLNFTFGYLDFLDWDVWIELEYLDTWLGIFGLNWIFWIGLGWIFWIGIFGLNWIFG